VTISPTSILELCAAVAASHGKVGKAIAKTIRAIDLDLMIPIDDLPIDGGRRKYIYRESVKGHQYIYFRAPKGHLTRLPTDESSKEFWKEYLRCWREMKLAK
jgi:hypothetical protein